MNPGILVTSDGAVFHGDSVGAEGIATGEAVFNTAMSGYQEILTDPSYAGQVVVMTSPHIGNYGVAAEDDQAMSPQCTGLVVRTLSRMASSWRAQSDLGTFLRSHRVVALSGIDTRRLTRHIRDRGAMPVAVGGGVAESEVREAARSAPTMEGRSLALAVSTPEAYVVEAVGDRRGSVVALDLGMKRDIAHRLAEQGLEVTVVPASTTPEQILAMRPDGVFLSNGPGDPGPLTGPIETVQGLLGAVGVFGICLGHQVLGLALGARTFKLPFGHHGGNHPVRRLDDGRVEITAQNHGFAVDLWSLAGKAGAAGSGAPGHPPLPAEVESPFGAVQPTHQNLNDGTLEGLRCRDVPAFSVQYHPEGAPGPRDAAHLFGSFLRSIEAA